MKFYEMLVKSYDTIFPFQPDTFRFIREGLHAGDKVLDAACGTGTYTLPLQEEGILACGVDLEEAMIEEAEKKRQRLGIDGDFVVSNMLDIDLVSEGDLRRIFIIGNSLVHLHSLDEVRNFLASAYDLLAKEGDLLLQIINYDRILDQKITKLPDIRVPEAELLFLRRYQYDPAIHKVEFSTTLTLGTESRTSTVDLLPLRRAELEEALNECGFTEIDVYGDFKKSPWTPDSMMLVMAARKLK